MNRRQFVCTATGAATFVRIPDVLAAAVKYDLIVKGDASSILRASLTRSVTWRSRKAVSRRSRPTSPADAVETIDARGKLVVPGLIDIHTHATRVK